MIFRSYFDGLSVSCIYAENEIGFESSTASADCIEEHVWYINRVFVNAKFRRKGIGTKMVEKLKEEIKGRDPKAMLIVTPGGYDIPLKSQIAFYNSIGFKDYRFNDSPCLMLKV